MLSAKNLLKPASGEPITIPSQDMVLGCYYMTHFQKGKKGEGKIFANEEEAKIAYHFDNVDLMTEVEVDVNGERMKTSVGRILFNEIMPAEIGFVNEEMDKGKLRQIVARSLEVSGGDKTAKFVDDLKNLAFSFVTRSGISWGMNDLVVPDQKENIIKEARKKVEAIDGQYIMGLLTDRERKNQVIEVWREAKNKITTIVRESLNKTGPQYRLI